LKILLVYLSEAQRSPLSAYWRMESSNRCCADRFTRQSSFNFASGSERGNVLITTLVIMSMVIALGVSSVDSVVMEQRMVLSYQNQNIAFSVAENALRAAEYFITELTDPTIATTNENYMSWNQANRKAFQHMDFSQIDWSQVVGENNNGDLKSAYKIQYLGQRHLVGEELAIGQRSQIYGSRAEFFRIGAYGEGPQRAKRVIDVVFATLI